MAVLIVAVAAAVILFAVLREGDDDEGSGAPSTSPTVTATTGTTGTGTGTGTGGTTDTAPTPGSGTDTETTKTNPPTSTRPAASSRPRFVQLRVNARSATIARPTVARGKNVLLLITGPPGEEVHLHGYDRTVFIPPGGTAKLAFKATLPGRFEIELEKSSTQIGEITVK